MLTANRPQYAKRAVEAFRAQTYANKRLYICDTGIETCGLENLFSVQIGVFDCRDAQRKEPRTIGDLRNMAGRNITSDILLHWDDDDYSHPNRIAEQVALLQSSGADVVGYNELLFWREPQRSVHPYGTGGSPIDMGTNPGEAWLYSSKNRQYALGTSFCMWRSAWQRKPFEATSIGEDERFLRGLKVAAVSSLPQKCSGCYERQHLGIKGEWCMDCLERGFNNPRMLARIHGSNTSTAYRDSELRVKPEWQRVPEWDSYCRSIMSGFVDGGAVNPGTPYVVGQ